ncbi:ethanolamine ammonia-lyase subunit EutC [Variovorax dokdonensis]|uniref:Ethanolamine ammonia-lyase small subunit n=1 Tax=Variovorax dokdonensis TaxID=344883 RepID=A0ABT7NDH5_9BURK|nr:ethanolamine ammonia-lyase subunit EutC [Variovorax dokdonensis]MDM0046005.1 ethanolamine ammonia-lyase subunit EutC [Variovorax dokdonensis]
MTTNERSPAAPDKESPAWTTPSPWTAWRDATPARIALGRSGDALPTGELLRFGWAHAGARDAIHAQADFDALQAQLQDQHWPAPPLCVRSQAPDRATYLRRPDLGRALAPEDAQRLDELGRASADGFDLCLVIGDGLSALAIERHAVPLLSALRSLLPATLAIAPLVLAEQARVALADDIGQRLRARLSVIALGERPGLSAPDSLGVYLTFSPRVGNTDAQRNCISNVRTEGQTPAQAAARLAWLIRMALKRGESGVALKDESEYAVLDDASPNPRQHGDDE